MPSSIPIAAFVVGAVLLLVALLGGGFDIFGARIQGSVGRLGRSLAGVLSAIFLAIALLGSGDRITSERIRSFLSPLGQVHTDLAETTWDGTLSGTSSEELQILLKRDGTAVAQRGPTWPDGGKVLDHCNWAASAGAVKMECPYETSGADCPNAPCITFHLPKVYNLTLVGSSLKGSMDEPYYDPPHRYTISVTKRP